MIREGAVVRKDASRPRFLVSGAAALLASASASLLVASPARAEPGTHGPSISTWDTRASSVVIGFRPGFLSHGHFDMLSYNANFSSTSGDLSGQFGVHYLNVRTGEGLSVLQGMGATAIALFSIPALPRYDNGQPKLAVGLYVGSAPSVLINGHESYLSVPFPLGIGLPYSPAPQVLITPWFEASPGVNLDTQVRESTLPLDSTQFQSTNGSIHLTDAAVNQILNSAVTFRVRGTVGLRAGLDVAIRLADPVDLNLNAMLGSLGGGFAGTFVAWVGGGFTLRWDNVVPAVLPAQKRLSHEDCSAIETRYRECQAVDGNIMSPVPPSTNAPPSYRAPSPSYQTPQDAPRTYQQPTQQPAPYRPPSQPYPPSPAPRATPSPAPSGSSPPNNGVPTSSFPQ